MFFPKTKIVEVIKEVESKAIPVDAAEEERRNQPMTLDGQGLTEQHVLSKFRNLMRRPMTVGEFEDRKVHEAAYILEREALHKKIVDTLKGMWSNPHSTLEGKSEAELDQLYVPGVGMTQGWCDDCYDVRQSHINKGKRDIVLNATLQEYTDRVAELKSASKLLFCAEHSVQEEQQPSK